MHHQTSLFIPFESGLMKEKINQSIKDCSQNETEIKGFNFGINCTMQDSKDFSYGINLYENTYESSKKSADCIEYNYYINCSCSKKITNNESGVQDLDKHLSFSNSGVIQISEDKFNEMTIPERNYFLIEQTVIANNNFFDFNF